MGINIKSLFTLSILLAGLISKSLFGLSVGKVFYFNDLLVQAPHIVRLKISNGQMITTEKETDCGYRYGAEISENFGSDITRNVNFYSIMEMKIGVEYLIFLTDRPYPEILGGSSNLVDCTSIIKSKFRAYGDHGFALEFTKNHLSPDGEKLLHNPQKLLFPESIFFEKEVVSISIEGNDETTSFEAVKYLVEWGLVKDLIKSKD